MDDEALDSVEKHLKDDVRFPRHFPGIHGSPDPAPSDLRTWVQLRRERAAIIAAIRDYYFALDSRQHGGVAESAAFSRIEEVLGMQWIPGEEKVRRAGETAK